MKITAMIINLADQNDPYQAVIRLELDRELELEGIWLYETEDGNYYLQYPYLTLEDGTIREICYPVGADLKADIYLMAVNRYVILRNTAQGKHV